MKLYYFFGYSQAQAGASRFGGAGSIQPVKLLEYPVQLFFRNIYSFIFKDYFNSVIWALRLGCGYSYIFILIAVINRVAQKVVKYALELVGVAFYHDIRLRV